MEIFKYFRREPSEFRVHMNELEGEIKLNFERQKELQNKYAENPEIQELMRKAQLVYVDWGAKVNEIAWITGMRRYGLSDRMIGRLWTLRKNQTDRLRNMDPRNQEKQ